MRRHKSRREKRRQFGSSRSWRETTRWPRSWWLGVFVIFALASSTALAAIMLVQNYTRSTGLPSVSAIVSDISDRIDYPLRGQIEERLFNRVSLLPAGDQVIVSQLTPDPRSPLSIHFVEVAPPKASDCKFIGCTPTSNARERSELFSQPATRAIRRSLLPGKRPQTPLLEGVIAMARRSEFKSDDPSVQKSLMLVTDGLQHTTCSVYPPTRRSKRRSSRKSRQTVLNSEACVQLFEQGRGLFRNTDIEILWITRQAGEGRRLQSHELKEWLEGFFINNGARQVRLVELQ